MWIIVLYDLPTETVKNRKEAQAFRKKLLGFGFSMFQLSMYIRHAPSQDNCTKHENRVMENLPPEGKVCIFHMTDKQFGEMKLFHCTKPQENLKGPQQLLLF